MGEVVHLRTKAPVDPQASGDIFKDLEEHLKRHDWYYAYSDDHGVWMAGEASRKKLIERYQEASKIDKAKAQKLFRKHAPHEVAMPD